jgi:hypothetical protein
MSPIDNLAERLKRNEEAFKAASADGPASLFDPPPDGDYQTLVHEFDFFEGGQPKQAYLKIRFQVQHHPEHAGRFCESVYSLEDPDRLDFLKSDLAKLVGRDAVEGLNFAVDLLPGSDFLESLLDVPVLVRVKTGTKINPRTEKPYVSIYLQQRLGDPVHGATPPGRLPTSGSDVPNDTSGFDPVSQQVAEDAENPLDVSPEARREALVDAGCVCEDPVAVADGEAGGHVDCPLPGHAQF